MSTKTIREAQGSYHSPFGQELAPSSLRADEPGAARLIGLVGLFSTIVGIAVVGMNWFFTAKGGPPRLIPEWMGYVAATFGIGALLFHASRDSDIQIRRTYGIVGGILVIFAVIMALIAAAYALALIQSENNLAGMFLAWGVPTFLLGLFFILPFVRFEDEATLRSLGIRLVGVLGALLALTGLIVGSSSSAFLLPHGAILALIGLVYVWATIGLVGSSSEWGYRIAWIAGIVGGLTILVALGRSIFSSHYFVPDGMVLISLGLLYVLLSVFVCSERQIVVLTRRELSAYFYSPIAYLTLFGMVIVCWLNYSLFLEDLRSPQSEPILRNYIVAFIPVFAIIFIVPVLTMRLLSEEHRTGTLEVMLTAPIDEPTVVLSKFFAGLLFFIVLCLPIAYFLIPLRVEGGKPFDVLPLASFFVALVGTGAAFIAMGLFFSSLTRNQIVAAVLTFMGMMVLLVLFMMANSGLLGMGSTAAVRQVSFIQFWLDSLRGKLYLRDLLGQLSLAILFLFMTVKVLESRKWK